MVFEMVFRPTKGLEVDVWTPLECSIDCDGYRFEELRGALRDFEEFQGASRCYEEPRGVLRSFKKLENSPDERFEFAVHSVDQFLSQIEQIEKNKLEKSKFKELSRHRG